MARPSYFLSGKGVSIPCATDDGGLTGVIDEDVKTCERERRKRQLALQPLEFRPLTLLPLPKLRYKPFHPLQLREILQPLPSAAASWNLSRDDPPPESKSTCRARVW
jgi:hypothetical protein